MILLQAVSSTQNDSNARERKDMDEAPERKEAASQQQVSEPGWRNAESLEDKTAIWFPWLVNP
ncbi:hypothetical protein PSCICL_38020 [Pseudomonas cichorii]|nr:hypothetical protein PSCICE_36980 [Pseudomonas cichorii]GFM58752.1 hypothetical protein PSCICF_49300 [Pseudomonas cichorii]GFM62696.1 hypothetical protein PSCICG_38560 [Pseudomonas cichorii]GFM72810.1 hypothetical protein PSCICL_38020 [Pseudomonas cichorii]